MDYIFNVNTGKLIHINSVLDNSTISLEYEDSTTWPVRFTHSNGKTFRVTYNDAGMISYVDLLSEDDRVIKTRYVIKLTIRS